MLTKILIANRGEIACRVIETARKMGVRTVAVYSDADADARHVAMADEAYRIGPPSVSESYLKGDVIIETALKSGAEAIHPGYGFLSENPDFVESVNAAGLRFIGPSADAIRAMGLKDAAKTLMEKAGVPVVPGYHGDNQDADFLAGEAEQIGYPVLIKARAGGGGKGMRKVERPVDFHAALEGAQREGMASFGDASCLVEKWVTTPRHIEIQVFGDDHGNVVHLFERDCSLQRRHQKVIEEAPAPGMTFEMRAAMGDAAVRCAKAVSYSGAGTVEFIVDASDGLRPDRFWFMEMNTRLQVEHPVTEAITGVDLVEWQLRVASGEALPLKQDSLTVNGHAFEARIYAEDVPAGFLPATGKLEHLAFSERARIDSGVREGDAITPWYDPMIAKITVHGGSRDIALGMLERAIDETHVAGTVTNLEFLSALCRNAGFAAAEMDTGLIERDLGDLVPDAPVPDEIWRLAAAVALGAPFDAGLAGWVLWRPLVRNCRLVCREEEREVQVVVRDAGTVSVTLDDREAGMEIAALRDGMLAVTLDGARRNVACVRVGDGVAIFDAGRSYHVEIKTHSAVSSESHANPEVVVSPMPGCVKHLHVQVGDRVAKGDAVAVVEAMKMEHTLTALCNGNVREIAVGVGDQVDTGGVLVMLEQDDG